MGVVPRSGAARQPQLMGPGKKKRVPRRRQVLPYLAAALVLVVGVAHMMNSFLDAAMGEPEGVHRQLSVSAHSNETCLPKEGIETDMKAVACLLYVLGILVCFLGLAVLCDDYFEGALMVISLELELSKDVAGATFMAAGGSAPELFTSLLTCMTTQSSAGVGTILGSAVFNLVVIISLSSLVSDGDLLIDYRPVVRDCVAYSLSIITMAVCALTPITSDLPELNGKSGFSFWEAMFMTLMYVGYIVMMSQNKKVMAMIGAPPPGFEEEEEEEEVEPEPETAENPLEAAKEKASAMKASISAKMNKGDGDEENASDEGAEEKKDEEEEEGGIFSIISMPFSLLFSATIPACDDDDWEVGQEGGAKYYWGAFTMCILWIGVLTLAMVAWADRLGCMLGINSFIMGLVVLAAGTSVPDALASIAVAKDGEGGMAVSNAIGSNVFDILLGLGLPFMAFCIVWDKAGYASGDEVEVLVACIQLQVILFVVVVAMWLSKWKLSSNLGGGLMALYFFYVGFNILVDRDVIPILGPMREAMGLELVSCENERC